METIKFTIKGASPILMHAPTTVDPLHPLTVQMKKVTSKRKKTEEDQEIIAQMELEAGIYYDDKLGPYIPGACIDAAIAKGAAMQKRGRDIKKAYMTFDERVKLLYKGPRELAKLVKAPDFIDRRPVKVGTSKVMRTRAIFREWEAIVEAMYDPAIFDLADLQQCIELTGRYVGLLDFRPRFGRFNVEWPK